MEPCGYQIQNDLYLGGNYQINTGIEEIYHRGNGLTSAVCI